MKSLGHISARIANNRLHLIGFVWIFCSISCTNNEPASSLSASSDKEEALWKAPDTSEIPHNKEGALIRYGRDLIANTALYFGQKGTIAQTTNGMNCQNCHLDAGTRPWGNNYGRARATFPNFRARSGTIETLEKRVNDCLERSLNGKPIDTAGKEMQAIIAYMTWLGKNVPNGSKPHGTGIKELEYLDRPADVANGEQVYKRQCQRCHNTDGSGVRNPDLISYQYPPLWGENSYTTAAGLYRLSRIAGYVKENMPFDSVNLGKALSIGDAWDVGAFVISQPRPVKTFKEDWPDISAKPPDHPFGPFIDSFPEAQHKYGPFGPIVKAQKEYKEKKLSAN
jgi:thiosulfate dehydrogenase